MKKKLLLGLSSFIATLVLVPAVAMAAPAGTVISGTVTSNSKGVNGANVIVVCDNNQMTTTTTSDGDYAVVYVPASQCPSGDTAYVTATSGSKGGVNNKAVKSNATDTINVAIVNVSLPEFGIVTGIGAAVIGGGAFLIMRRRQHSGHQA